MLKKIAILGNGGGGKSTAARELSQRLDLPVYSVDQIQFEPGWQRADPCRVKAWHEEILVNDRWILDGWGAWDLIDARLAACEAVLLIDFPLEVHLEWAARRSEQSRRGNQPDAPPGCSYHEVEALMDETLRRVDSEFMPILRDKITAVQGQKVVVWVKDPAEWRAGIEELISR